MDKEKVSSNAIPAAIAKAIGDARGAAFRDNQNTSIYADGINNLANENSDGELDIANLADENNTAITDLAEYVASLEERIMELEGRI